MARRDEDPYGGFNFLVEIEGLTVAGFTEVSGLTSEIDVIEYREGSDKTLGVRKLPGLAKYGGIVLKRGITASSELWDWHKSVMEGNTERRDGAIVLLNEAREPVLRYRFRAGWPAKWEGPAFNAKSSNAAIETLEIVTEGIDVEYP